MIDPTGNGGRFGSDGGDDTFNDEETSTELPIMYTILEASVSVIATIGNLLVIIVFLQDRRLRKVTNFYIISLSLADFLVGTIGIPSAIMIKIGLPRSSMKFCLIMLSLLIVLCTISILNLVAVSLDRYWAILHPLDYHKRISEKTAFAIICACWILGSIIGFLPLFGWRNEYQDSCYFIPLMDYNFLTFLYIVTIVIPALVMALFYIRIYIVVIQQLSLNKVRQLSDPKFCRSKFKHRKSSYDISDFKIEYDESNFSEQNSAINCEYACNKHPRPSLQHNWISMKMFPPSRNSINNCPSGCHMTDNLGSNQSINLTGHCSESIRTNRSKSRSLSNVHKLDDHYLNDTEATMVSRKHSSKQSNVSKFSYSRREVKKAQKLFVIVVFFMICWIPLYTWNAIQAICRDCIKVPSLLDSFIILSHINSAGSPFLYAFQMKDFRLALRRLICKGAFNQKKLRDLRREELFSVSGQRNHTALSKECREFSLAERQRNPRFNRRHNHQTYFQKCQFSSYHSSIEQISAQSFATNSTLNSKFGQKSATRDSNQKYFTVPMRNIKTRTMVLSTLKE